MTDEVDFYAIVVNSNISLALSVENQFVVSFSFLFQWINLRVFSTLDRTILMWFFSFTK